MSRIPLPSPETMTAEQLKVYEDILAGPRDTLVGPLRAALHHPELASRWQKLGALLRFETSLPPRLSELAILATARRWNSQVEWHIHAQAARTAKLSDDVIEAIRFARCPEFSRPDEAAIYEFVRHLQETGSVPHDLYQTVLQLLNEVGVVELTAIVGYYTMVAMTLNAHEIPLPAGVATPLGSAPSATASQEPVSGLTTLTPSRMVTPATLET